MPVEILRGVSYIPELRWKRVTDTSRSDLARRVRETAKDQLANEGLHFDARRGGILKTSKEGRPMFLNVLLQRECL